MHGAWVGYGCMGPGAGVHRGGPFAHLFARLRGRWAEGEGWSGPPFGPFGRRFGGFGPPSPERLFGRGDLKYVILDLLRDQPRHGYDVIRALEERFRGFYTPSPGSVYPTLQMLEDQGSVTSSQQDGKRIYAITDAGRRLLEEQKETVEELRGRAGGGWGSALHGELGEVLGEVRQLGRFLFRQGARGGLHDPQKLRRLREVVARARREIEAIFGDEPTTL